MVFETHVIAHKTVAKGTHEVTFARPQAFTFAAGQYTQVAVPALIAPDPKGRSRQFSLASSPEDTDTIKVVFRDSGSGFKKTLMAAPINSTVTVEQAAGSFLLPREIRQPQVFVAGGIGITPFMSYLPQLRAQDTRAHQVTLIYGNRNEESAAYLDELEALAVEKKHFALTSLYERPTPAVFAKLAQEEYPGAIWWIVGPPAMVSVVVGGLQSGGVSRNNILTESFVGY
jgi:ferredoxin-NADP reductase